MKGKKTKNNILLLFIVFSLLTNCSILLFIDSIHAEQIKTSFYPDMNKPPNKPQLVSPGDGSKNNPTTVTLKVHVTDQDEDPSQPLYVYFYDASNGQLIDSDISAHGFNASISWSGLSRGQTYSWYTVVNDSLNENQSNIWSFKTREPTQQNPPDDDEPILTPPNAVITAPTQANISEPIFFIGNQSYDSDGYIVSYEWDFNNDGITDITTENTNYTINNTGNHTIALTVTDNNGLSDTTIHKIKIVQYPIAKINTTWGNIGYIDDEKPQNLRFCANESYDPDGNITNYRWDFNIHDNITWNTGWLNSTVKHYVWNYSKTGNYTIKLQVKDNDNLTDIDLFNITITNITKKLPTPIIKVVTEAYIGENIYFNSSESYDSDGKIQKFTWYFGDGKISHQKNPIHTYNKTGIYLVILEVTDNDNLTNAEISWINIIKKPEETKKPKDTYKAPLIFLIAVLLSVAAAIIALIIYLNKRKPKEKKKNKENKNKKSNNIKNIIKIPGIGTAIVNILEKEGIHNLEKLNSLTDNELKQIKGIGDKTTKSIKKNLAELLKEK